MSVYAVRQPNGLIKIGYTATPEKRIRNLETQGGFSVEILAVVDGTRKIERALHQMLDEHRVEGEWFADCDEVRSAIEDLRAGLIDEVDAKHQLGQPGKFSLEALEAVRQLQRFYPEDSLEELSKRTSVRRAVIWALLYRTPHDLYMSDYKAVLLAVSAASNEAATKARSLADKWSALATERLCGPPPLPPELQALLDAAFPRTIEQ